MRKDQTGKIRENFGHERARSKEHTVCQNSLRTGDKNIPKQMIHKDNHIYHLITFSNGFDLKSY